jgi:hypothetical protein
MTEEWKPTHITVDDGLWSKVLGTKPGTLVSVNAWGSSFYSSFLTATDHDGNTFTVDYSQIIPINRGKS